MLTVLAIALLVPQATASLQEVVRGAPTIIYVSHSAKGSTGESWDNAFNDLTKALAAATRGAEVWVAQGTYAPTPGSRNNSFDLMDGVVLRGGFVGHEQRKEDRPADGYLRTILTGDPDNTGKGSYHVVRFWDYTTNASATLESFTVTRGNANGDRDGRLGGGLLAMGCGLSAHVHNVLFTENTACQGGAVYDFGMCGEPAASLGLFDYSTYTNCTFFRNRAISANCNGGGEGGAIISRDGSMPNISDSYFVQNHADLRGGAIYADYGSRPTYTRCVIDGNKVGGHGGGAYFKDRASQIGGTKPVFQDSRFSRNVAHLRGGGIAVTDKVVLTLSSVTFDSNEAGRGGGLAAWYSVDQTNMGLKTCTFTNNTCTNGKGCNADNDYDTDSTTTAEAWAARYNTTKYANAVHAQLWAQRDIEAEGAPDCEVFYVSANATAGKQDGTSWENAFTKVQSGIDAAAASQHGAEVWVAEAVYLPTATILPSETDKRNRTFVLKPKVALYGGFAGSEATRAERNWLNHPTVLSGDIDGDGTRTNNVYHVVSGSSGARLDGFIVQGGNACSEMSGPSDEALRGPPPGGLCGFNPACLGPPGPTHTTIGAVTSCAAPMIGAGLMNFQAATATANTLFFNNWAMKGGHAYNMRTVQGDDTQHHAVENPSYVNVGFVGAYSRMRGGAMSNDLFTHPSLERTIFVGNACTGKGGAIYNDFECSPTISNSYFAENYAYESAGAIGNDGGSQPYIADTLIHNNSAEDLGAALYQGSYNANSTLLHSVHMFSQSNAPTVKNVTMTDNTCVEYGLQDACTSYDWHLDVTIRVPDMAEIVI